LITETIENDSLAEIITGGAMGVDSLAAYYALEKILH
jgi:predicted Rossmann fold nucleotide-binding protein DprA/Smf involved in DNA uptake